MIIIPKPVKLMPDVYSVLNIPGTHYVTKNMVPGTISYGEQLLYDEEGTEYRAWSHNKSKLASGMLSGMRVPVLKRGCSVLYLGASSGTTVSHVSDIIGERGVVYAVEFSPRSMRELMNEANARDNIIPILADARKPEEYTHIVDGVDLVYVDVAQPSQSKLFTDNANAFLNDGGMGYIAVKTRSISQTQRPDVIFKKEVAEINKHFEQIKTVNIGKYHKEHFVYLGRWTK